jgi:hypothetical protein
VLFEKLARRHVEDEHFAAVHDAEPFAVARQVHAHVVVGHVFRPRHSAQDLAVIEPQDLCEDRLAAENQSGRLALAVEHDL